MKHAEKLRAVAAKVTERKATVALFLEILKSYLTQYDQKEEQKERSKGYAVNIYRLGILFKALDEVRDELKPYMDDDSKEAMDKLKASMDEHFHVNQLSATRKLLKQIDAWVNDKKAPRLGKL